MVVATSSSITGLSQAVICICMVRFLLYVVCSSPLMLFGKSEKERKLKMK